MKEHFIQQTRDDGTSYWSLKDANEEATGAPDWLRDAVYAAHDGEMPNDWRYATCRAIAEAIDDGQDDASEIADSLVDVYTADLLAWLAGNLNRTTCVDDAASEMGVAGATLMEQITQGQYYCISGMASILIEAWQESQDES